MPLISNRRWVIFYYVKSIKLTTTVLHLKSTTMAARWLQAKTIPGVLLQNIHGHNRTDTLLILFKQNTWIQIYHEIMQHRICLQNTIVWAWVRVLSHGHLWLVILKVYQIETEVRTIKCFEKTIQNIKLNGKTTWDSQKCVIRTTIMCRILHLCHRIFRLLLFFTKTEPWWWDETKYLAKTKNFRQISPSSPKKCTNYFVFRRI